MRVTLPNWGNARVLVIGDVMLDRYWHGGTSRISPEAPVPVVHIQEVEERVGGAGNVALNISALGGRATVLGVVGRDEAANLLAERLNQAQVNSLLVPHDTYPTVTKLRVISRHQQLIRLDFEDDFECVPVGQLLARMRSCLNDVDVVVLSDYGKGVLSRPRPLIDAARDARKLVLVDPKSKDFSRYRGATIVTPNVAEFEAVVGPCRDETEIVAKGQKLIVAHSWEALLVTRGEQGMTLLQANEAPIHLPTQAKEVFDVTGAGDTVVSVLSAALAAGEELEMATFLANVAAGIVVTKLGTATVTVPELHRALNTLHEYRYGILPEQELIAIVQDAKTRGETLVMTNGCFDILHAGHVRYLEEARKRGDRLIVAVNDDASVTRLKGVGRPINTLENRMAVVAALESVDWVVPFSEDTPERLICAILPDILVKGGDYEVHEVAGGTCVEKNGGEVVILEFKNGCSTTTMINAIRDSKG